MTLNVNSLFYQSYRVSTKRLRLESRGFRYKVALYLGYLSINFDDVIKGNPLNFKHASIGLALLFCSQILQQLRLLAQIYGN